MKKSIMLAIATLMATVAVAQTQVIAHRGFHTTKGSCRNSKCSTDNKTGSTYHCSSNHYSSYTHLNLHSFIILLQ